MTRRPLQTRDEVLELGIDKYNQHCRSIVMRCEAEWKDVVPRMGRWIDFEGGYKTMDLSYMESVWWVFKVSHCNTEHGRRNSAAHLILY